MGTHLRVLSESFPMNTNMTGFRWFSKIFQRFSRVALALEGLTHSAQKAIGISEYLKFTCKSMLTEHELPCLVFPKLRLLSSKAQECKVL